VWPHFVQPHILHSDYCAPDIGSPHIEQPNDVPTIGSPDNQQPCYHPSYFGPSHVVPPNASPDQ
jgi:hypothetical protein